MQLADSLAVKYDAANPVFAKEMQKSKINDSKFNPYFKSRAEWILPQLQATWSQWKLHSLPAPENDPRMVSALDAWVSSIGLDQLTFRKRWVSSSPDFQSEYGDWSFIRFATGTIDYLGLNNDNTDFGTVGTSDNVQVRFYYDLPQDAHAFYVTRSADVVDYLHIPLDLPASPRE